MRTDALKGDGSGWGAGGTGEAVVVDEPPDALEVAALQHLGQAVGREPRQDGNVGQVTARQAGQEGHDAGVTQLGNADIAPSDPLLVGKRPLGQTQLLEQHIERRRRLVRLPLLPLVVPGQGRAEVTRRRRGLGGVGDIHGRRRCARGLGLVGSRVGGLGATDEQQGGDGHARHQVQTLLTKGHALHYITIYTNSQDSIYKSRATVGAIETTLASSAPRHSDIRATL